MLAKMVSDITGIDYSILENNVILEINELPIQRYNEKAKRCDFILRVSEDKIINLELNLSNYPEAIIKNLSYIFHLFSTSSKRGDKYDDNLIVTQINLNCYEEEKDNPLRRYHLREDDSHELYVKNLVIYDLNIVKCHEIYYNETDKENLPNYIKWGTLIYTRYLSDMVDVINSFLDKKERDIIMAGVSKLTREDLFYSKEEQEEWDRWMENSRIAREEAEMEERVRTRIEKEVIAQGIEQGIEQNIKEIVIALNENESSLEFISKITGKTIEEIKEILNNN